MLTCALMLGLVLFLAASVVYGVKVDEEKDSFMLVNDTSFLRGFWCIIVVLVHVPVVYQNRVQDIIGSFAYIGVTFFFMTSAYGLKYSMIHKKGYMEHFWRRRLPMILIPAVSANAFEVIVRGLERGPEEISFISFLNIDNWVKTLLLYYLSFWLIYYIIPKLIGGGDGSWQDIGMCLFVAVCSAIERFTSLNINYGWIVEPLGFAYGIIAANHADSIRRWMKERWLLKCGILMVLSGFLGIAYLKLKPVVVFGDYFLKIALGISMIAFMFEVISGLKVGNKLNAFLGDISYEIYLLHRGVFALLAVIDADMNSGAFVVASVGITVALSYALNRIGRPIVRMFRQSMEGYRNA